LTVVTASRRRCAGRLVGGLVALALLAGPASVGAQAMPEDKVKAALLFKFLSYVEWPPSALAAPDAAIVVGLLGADALAPELQAIVAERRVGERSVAVRKLRRGMPLAGVHVLFIGRSEGSRIVDVLEDTRDQPILVVTELEEAFAAGSVINFVVVDDKMRFDVAPRAAERHHIKISARLLSVARRVVGEAP
jgi:hypothetical protein